MLSAAILLGLALALLFAVTAFAEPDEVVLEGEALDRMEVLRDQSEAVQKDINTLNKELEQVVEQHNATRVYLDQLTMDLADSRIRLDEARALHAAQEELISQRMVAVYKADQINVFTILLDSSSFTDFYEKTRYMVKINEQDTKLERQLLASSEEIGLITEEIDHHRSEQMRLEKDLREQEAQVKVKIDQRQAVYDQLDSEIKRIIDEEAARQRAEREKAAAEAAALLSDLGISDTVQAQVVQTALQYLGVPYVWGGESPAGLDCSGLTKIVYAQHGVNLPHNAAMQFALGVPVPPDQLQPGDLVFWGPGHPHHVAMYIGKGNYIEAPTFGEVVSIDKLTFNGDYAGARRFPLKAHNS